MSLDDALVVVGMVMLATGLSAYDWRLALVVCGALLLSMGLVAAMRGARYGRRE